MNDATDNCPADFNPDQRNSDGPRIDLSPFKLYDDATFQDSDALPDACGDTDDDNDGLSDADEPSGAACGGVSTHPQIADTDGDLFLDNAECALGTDPTDITDMPLTSACGPVTDTDGDSLPAFREFCFYGTDPALANTDGDACNDGREIASINGDAAVNVIDLQQIATVLGSYALPGTVVQRDFDFTRNGSIDVIDLGQVSSRSGPCP